MLTEIKCDKFRQKSVTFRMGLNVLLGDDNASNSIGKSTMLHVVDFVLGGDYYATDTDVINNIGHHEIFFQYKFGNDFSYFSRATQTAETVFICDENYVHTKEISLTQFRDILKEKYLGKSDLSFRNYIGLFSRVYGKENLEERKPLSIVHAEKGSDSIARIIKIFGQYDQIAEQQKVFDTIKTKYDILRKASEAELIAAAKNKSEYLELNRKIQNLQSDIEEIQTQLISSTLDLSVEQLRIIAGFKQELVRIQSMKQVIVSDIAKLSALKTGNCPIENSDIHQLQEYFPQISISELTEIETFHQTLSVILTDEIERQLKTKNEKLHDISEREKEELAKISTILKEDNPRKVAVENLIEYQKTIDSLLSQQGCYEQRETSKINLKNAKTMLDEIKEQTLAEIGYNVNKEIEANNDYIFNAQKKAPLLMLEAAKYDYKSADDTGTGTQYKNLILLDLAILKLTHLPVLIHDSVLFKNVEYETMNKLITLYSNFSDKQIFIATDAKQNFSDDIQNLINSTTFLQLWSGGGELFGKSWSNK